MPRRSIVRPALSMLGVALPFLPAAWLAIAGWRARWTAEDAFIHFRVVDHLLSGNGPVFNAGERVEASTSPLWIALLALARAVTRAPIEWIALVLGLALAAAGLAAAAWGALRLGGTRARVALPVGAAFVAAFPPFHDFATSGMETALCFAWLGASFAALVARRRPRATAALLGLGPLVRPDLAVFSCAFLAALVALERPRPRALAALLACAASLPAGYQVFRMGYYGSVVPNPALAKEAALSRWDQGFAYLRDAYVPHEAGGALVVLLLALAWSLAGLALARDRDRLIVAGATAGAALLHGLYVVRVGGDFMHARLLLPALFALAAPVAALGASRASALALAALLPWALAAARIRLPYAGGVEASGIADERGFYVVASGEANPVTLADYHRMGWTRYGARLRDLARRLPPSLLLWRDPRFARVALAPGEPARLAVAWPNVGLLGFAAGRGVHVVDGIGLCDPLAARVRIDGDGRRGRPGHEKRLPDPWIVARRGSADDRFEDGLVPADAVAAAREALACGSLRDLLDATAAPLTIARFLRNLGRAGRLTTLRVPADPFAARWEICGR